MPAHKKGKEVRQLVSIRLEPRAKKALEKHYGGVQAAVDSLVRKHIKDYGIQKLGKKFEKDIEKTLGITPIKE